MKLWKRPRAIDEDKLNKEIGENIRQARVNSGITIAELSEMLDLSTAYVSQIERGKRGARLTRLMQISEILNV